MGLVRMTHYSIQKQGTGGMIQKVPCTPGYSDGQSHDNIAYCNSLRYYKKHWEVL